MSRQQRWHFEHGLTEGAFEEVIPALGDVDVEAGVGVLEDHLVPPLFRGRPFPDLGLLCLKNVYRVGAVLYTTRPFEQRTTTGQRCVWPILFGIW